MRPGPSYLLSKTKSLVILKTRRSELIFERVGDRIPKTLIRDLVVSILANLIYDALKFMIAPTQGNSGRAS
jgi:hypothetical protein